MHLKWRNPQNGNLKKGEITMKQWLLGYPIFRQSQIDYLPFPHVDEFLIVDGPSSYSIPVCAPAAKARHVPLLVSRRLLCGDVAWADPYGSYTMRKASSWIWILKKNEHNRSDHDNDLDGQVVMVWLSKRLWWFGPLWKSWDHDHDAKDSADDDDKGFLLWNRFYSLTRDSNIKRSRIRL